MNHVILIGNLGAEPELHETASGHSVMRLRLATSERWKDGSGNRREKTSWHRITYWSKSVGSLANMLHKGSKVAVHGKIEYREFDDKDGVRRYVTEINARDVQLLDRKEDNERRDPFPEPREPLTGGVPEDDDVPF